MLLLALVVAPAVLAGCLRPTGEDCLDIRVTRGEDEASTVTWSVREIENKPWPLEDLEYEVYPSYEGGPLERGALSRPGPALSFDDADASGTVTTGDAFVFNGTASEDVGGITVYKRLGGVAGGTVVCK